MTQQVNYITLQLWFKKKNVVSYRHTTLSNYTKRGKVPVGGKWKKKSLTFGINPSKPSKISEECLGVVNGACDGAVVGVRVAFLNSCGRASCWEAGFMTDLQLKSDTEMKFWHRKWLRVEFSHFLIIEKKVRRTRSASLKILRRPHCKRHSLGGVES